MNIPRAAALALAGLIVMTVNTPMVRAQDQSLANVKKRGACEHDGPDGCPICHCPLLDRATRIRRAPCFAVDVILPMTED